MTKQKFRPWNVFFAVIALIWVVLFFVLALRTYFSDSEIWLLTVSQRLFTPHGLPSLYYKLSFHVVTYLFSHFAPSELAVYLWARFGWAVVGASAIALVARLFAKVYGRPEWLWPLFTFLITSALFINQGFRIRGDIFSLFLHALFLTFFFATLSRGARRRDFFILTAVNLALILSTPKSVLFIVCQTLLCWAWSRKSAHTKRLQWLLTFVTLVPVTVGCAFVLIAAAFNHYEFLSAISLAGDFFMKTFDTSLVNPKLYSATDFFHLFKFFNRSEGHALVFCIWLLSFFVLLFKRKPPVSSPAAPLQTYAALMFFFVIAYNQKLPFFLGPFMTPVLAQSFCFCADFLARRKPRWLTAGVVTALLLASATGVYNFLSNYVANANLLQRKAIEALDAYTTLNPEVSIYDVIGILPRKTTIFIFVGPSEVAQKTVILDSIVAADPQMILIVYKFKFLEPEFPAILQKYWVPLAPDVWAKGRFLSSKETPENFSRTIDIKGSPYWLMPFPAEHTIMDPSSHQTINNETFGLDGKKQLTQTDPVYLAVPKSRLALILTDVPPLELKPPTSVLFRYDTQF